MLKFEIIEKILQEPAKPNHNDFEKVIHARRYRKSHDKKINRRKKEEKEEEHTAEITYESEFESEESENENDSNVITEISVTETTE